MGSPVRGALRLSYRGSLPRPRSHTPLSSFSTPLDLLSPSYTFPPPFCMHQEWCLAFLRAEYHLVVSHRSRRWFRVGIWRPGSVCLGYRTNIWPVIGICCRCLKEQEECANRTIGVFEPWRDKGISI